MRSESTSFRVFTLQPYGRGQPLEYVVITPDYIANTIISAAWSYAVRYTAKGLDLPDYDAALALLKQRHPTWTVIESRVMSVEVNLGLAEKDVPEEQA